VRAIADTVRSATRPSQALESPYLYTEDFLDGIDDRLQAKFR
jgi:hypothetical protein